jgi:hypothetical protein
LPFVVFLIQRFLFYRPLHIFLFWSTWDGMVGLHENWEWDLDLSHRRQRGAFCAGLGVLVCFRNASIFIGLRHSVLACPLLGCFYETHCITIFGPGTSRIRGKEYESRRDGGKELELAAQRIDEFMGMANESPFSAALLFGSGRIVSSLFVRGKHMK